MFWSQERNSFEIRTRQSLLLPPKYIPGKQRSCIPDPGSCASSSSLRLRYHAEKPKLREEKGKPKMDLLAKEEEKRKGGKENLSFLPGHCN